MSAERVTQSDKLFERQCLSEVIGRVTDERNGVSALPILGASKELGVICRGNDQGVTRRILICARCSVLTWLEHDEEFNITDVQKPQDITGIC